MQSASQVIKTSVRFDGECLQYRRDLVCNASRTLELGWPESCRTTLASSEEGHRDGTLNEAADRRIREILGANADRLALCLHGTDLRRPSRSTAHQSLETLRFKNPSNQGGDKPTLCKSALSG